MLSVDTGGYDNHWLNQQTEKLNDFFRQIETCISDSDWESLSGVLTERQECLEQIFLPSAPDALRSALKKLAETILAQDQNFQTQIQAKKAIASNEQRSLERGRRAINAYQNL